MGKKIGTIMLIFIVALSGLGLNATKAVAAAPQFTGDYFGLGFDSHESDKMEISDGWSNGGMFNCTWRASNVAFSNGIMNLTINNDSQGGYSGGEYRTKQAFGYGMYDVSMKAIKNDGVVTSFFTYTGPADGTIWDEIDIEILGKDTTKVQFNYFTNGVGNHEYIHNLGFDASQGFHQYGFLWLPNSITWYVDGTAVYTATTNIPSTPGRIMMNVWPGIGVDSWLNPYNGVTPLTGQYDWASFTKVGTGDFDSSKLYSIISKHSGKALDVYYGSQDNGANVLQYTYNGYNNQKWYVQKQSNGYYIIKNLASGKVLDAAGTANGSNVQQWEYGGGANQEWSIENVNGYYKIINRGSGKSLDVANISAEDNANVQQWDYLGQDNQLWSITALN